MTIALARLRAHLARGSGLWQGRTTDEDAGEDDTHLTAWAWVDRPGDVELAGAQVQVRHATHTGGQWLTVIE